MPPTPPPPTPEQVAQIAKDTAIRDMVALVSNGNLFAPASVRILQALENPLSHAPEAQRPLRHACAQVLRDMLRDSEDGIPTLSPQITPECMLALDARFGWLNDYIAFRQDFGHHTTLQHELASRAYGNIQLAARPVSTEPAKTGIDARVLVFGGIILLKVILIATTNSDAMTGDDMLGLAGFAVVVFAPLLDLQKTVPQVPARFSRQSSDRLACGNRAASALSARFSRPTASRITAWLGCGLA